MKRGNDYYSVEADTGKNHIYFSMIGDIPDVAAITSFESDWHTTVAELKPGFTILGDLSKCGPLPADVEVLNTKVQGLFIVFKNRNKSGQYLNPRAIHIVEIFKYHRKILSFMYAIGTAAALLGVCIKTLRRWDAQKRISCVRTPGGHRRFPIHEITRFLTTNHKKCQAFTEIIEEKQKCAIYGRVSSHKQYTRGDLARQVEQLKDNARQKGMTVYHVYKDVGSGLNARRKNLWKLLRDARKGAFSQVLLTYKDRLTRFGFEYLRNYLAEFNVSLHYLHEMDEKTPESEMVEDLVAIIHSFSGKLYRMRRLGK